MGEMADWLTEQMMFPFNDDLHQYEEPIVDENETAEQEFSRYKETIMPKTYSVEVNSEKKIYRVKPPLARGSFMQRILEPEGFAEGDAKEWGCQLRWPMDDPEVQAWAKEMGGMFRQVFIDKFGDKKGAEMLKSPNIKIPLRNGDHEENEEYHGQLFMNVRNKFRQPIVIGPTGKALPVEFINDSVIYSGAWYRSRLIFRYYDVKSKGIGAYIDILMKIKDDTRLDSTVNIDVAEDEFSAFASDDVDELSPPKEGEDDNGFDFL